MHPTSVRTRPGAGAWSVFVVLAVAVGAAGAAEDAPVPVAAADVDLAADKVRYWSAAGARWALLEGRAAVFQDGEGLRAAAAIVRFAPEAPGSTVTRVDIYAAGPVQLSDEPGRTRADARRTFRTGRSVVLKPYDGRPSVALKAPPSHPLIARGFPEFGGQSAPAPKSPSRAPAVAALPPEVVPAPAAPVPIPKLEPVPGPAAPAPVEVASRPDSGVTLEAPVPIARAEAKPDRPAVDPGVKPAQFLDDLGPNAGLPPPMDDVPEVAPNDGPAGAGVINEEDDADAGPRVRVPIEVDPLPDPLGPPPAAPAPRIIPGGVEDPAVVMPYSQRTIQIAPLDAVETFKTESRRASDGTVIIIIRGGVQIVTLDAKNGLIDVEAQNAILWIEPDDDSEISGAGGKQKADKRLEIYLEGNVIVRQDKRKFAGPADQTIMKSDRAYLNLQTQRKIALNAEFNFFAPGLVSPLRTTSPVINSYTPELRGADGKVYSGPTQILTDRTVTTGSRFPKPGYQFSSRSVDLTEIVEPARDPVTGATAGNPRAPGAKKSNSWLIDARQNTYFVGMLPVFFWPRVLVESDDLNPPLRNIQYRYGNYFGHQVLLDWNMFKVLGIKRPLFIDNWNLDTDVLSMRGPALGTELSWFGRDLLGDLTDPYYKSNRSRDLDQPYFGYLDIWGILDHGTDVLGSGPAVVTYGPPGFGKRGFQRSDVPPPPNQDLRGKITFRHMQSLLGLDAPDDIDDRVQVEFGYLSDRHFLEEYYKRLFDTGMDQETLAYYIHQRENRAFTVHAEVNLLNWQTDTQWLPKFEYYRLGDSLLNNLFSYSTDSGIDYANTHTAVEVNNPNIFAFIPYDPVSNTSYNLSTGRAWTSHQLEMPLNFGFLRVDPYVQGQLTGWNNQLGGDMLGRAWGAYGMKANVMAWRAFPEVESELLNVHGLNHKINFNADYRNAFSNVNLNRIGVQDDLDDDSYEFTRRYFALTNYVGGVLPAQYDPRLLYLRRAISPIAGTTDIQGTIETLQLNINQRLQTRRGPEGRRRIIDYMILDLRTTYYPQASRDNFGKPFGQNMYNWEWYVGDRTTIGSYGWFEFWQIGGYPIVQSTPRRTNDPFGFNVINSYISINRPPRGNVTFNYSVINTGPIATSALTASYSYWLSPKWYSTFGTTYDFGNAILLGSSVALTRIGADFLTSVGLTVDPQRNNYTFGFEVVPRFSPQVRLGSASGLSRFDTRFAPVQ